MLDEDLFPKRKDPDRDPINRGFYIIRSFCLAFGLIGLGMFVSGNYPWIGRYVIFGALVLYALVLLADFLYNRYMRDS